MSSANTVDSGARRRQKGKKIQDAKMKTNILHLKPDPGIDVGAALCSIMIRQTEWMQKTGQGQDDFKERTKDRYKYTNMNPRWDQMRPDVHLRAMISCTVSLTRCWYWWGWWSCCLQHLQHEDFRWQKTFTDRCTRTSSGPVQMSGKRTGPGQMRR